MGRRGLLVLAALGVVAVNLIVVVAFLPDPAPPPNASPAERLYFLHCVTCHGAKGAGSWRSTIFLTPPGNLADPQRMVALPDQYLFDLIKRGGAALGKPGMPGFGFHLSDTEVEARQHKRHSRPAGRGRPEPRPR